MTINGSVYEQFVCNITSFNTTVQEFEQIVMNVNRTLVGNSLPNFDVLEETVLIECMFIHMC